MGFYERVNKSVRLKRYQRRLKRFRRRLIGYQLLGFSDTARYFALRLIPGKKRVGIGRVRERKSRMRVRGWRIDPLISGINGLRTEFLSEAFFDNGLLLNAPYDIVVFVKRLGYSDLPLLRRLRRKGKLVFYVIADKFAFEERLKLIGSEIDGIVATGPEQATLAAMTNSNVRIIHPMIINKLRKTDYTLREPARLIWIGNAPHVGRIREAIFPVVRRLKESVGPVELVINTRVSDIENRDADPDYVRYVNWSKAGWEKSLVESDIAIAYKPADSDYLQQKPATKLLSYLGSGMPVCCTPSSADKEILSNGKNGLVAETSEEWYLQLKRLLEDKGLRESIGRDGLAYATENFSAQSIGAQYIRFFRELSDAKAKAVGCPLES